ncbi:ABC transporter substrate-binding protein [Granulosicoccus sp. 3-233]|uniref:ABC transporter substrate-binding protein n=1 Tax=Granulosicoccus sp. 3-233 TaxID=3417969 RepID=UPI003D3468AE
MTTINRSTSAATAALAICAAMAHGVQAQELTVLTDSSPQYVKTMEALMSAYTAMHPDVTFRLESRPGGAEGDNLIKTRLATGEMEDIFNYNSGSLLQALRPNRTLLEISDLPAMEVTLDSFKQAVTGPEGGIYGVPMAAAMGGGILYHIPTYEKLGLEIPMTWDAFMENNKRIAEETDQAPIAQTYRDTWTSQLFVLSDYFNVQAESPDWHKAFTANEAKFSTTPAAMRGFEHLQEAHAAGYFNEDFGAATYADGLAMVASGEAVHYPMLTHSISAIQQNNTDQLQDIGFFAQPGDHADKNGLTVWMPAALYSPKSTEHADIVRDFFDFVGSVEGCETIIEAIGAAGPHVTQGCELPADIPPAIADMSAYFQEDGRTWPALEYLSPVKGPSLEQITVAVGSGINTAEEGAALYDQDVMKQARQLGLENW